MDDAEIDKMLFDRPWERPPHPDVIEAREFAVAALAAPTWCHLYPPVTRTNPCGIFAAAGRVGRTVRGRKMRSWDRLYDEFAAAWQFGYFFGENLNAFDDCMRDLHGTWTTTTGFVVVITEAEQVLSDESVDASQSTRHLEYLVESLQLVVDDYSEAIEGDPEDPTTRPALGFDVVLVTPPEHREAVTATWQAAGAPLEPSA